MQDEANKDRPKKARTVSVRMTEDCYRVTRELAQGDKRDLSEYVRLVLEEHVERKRARD